MPLSDYLTVNGATNGPIGAACSGRANAVTGNMPTLVDGVTFAHVELVNRNRPLYRLRPTYDAGCTRCNHNPLRAK